jgi:hypothetical protein
VRLNLNAQIVLIERCRRLALGEGAEPAIGSVVARRLEGEKRLRNGDFHQAHYPEVVLLTDERFWTGVGPPGLNGESMMQIPPSTPSSTAPRQR